MLFKNFAELLKHINTTLSEFTWEFIHERKRLSSLKRRPSNVLFKYDSEQARDWAINEGGGLEIQYHIAIDTSRSVLYYGLGFNTQYVQFANDKSMVEYAKPFMQGFLEHQNKIQESLPDYNFIIGAKSQLINPKNNQYNLFGKETPISLVENKIEIETQVLNEIITDLKKQFEAYKLIFEFAKNYDPKRIEMENQLNLIKYKKQIILQGPPGTGKTRLAKQIANTLTASNYSKLEVNDIKHSLHIGQKIDGASGQPAYYEIEKINESNVVLSSKYTKDGGHFAKFKKVIEYYQELVQGEEVKASRSHDSYELAVAKHFYYKSNNENYKLIQFHPSYTYEDFVRGITVKSGENNLEYITENKVLAKIAKEAYNNYLDSKKESSEITKEKWLENQFDLFKDSIEDEIENNESYPLTDTIGIQQVGKRYFKYVGNGWHDYIKYSDFLLLFEKDTYDRQAIKKLLNIGSRASYYAKLAEKFNGFLDQKSKPEQSNEKVDLKNYVLIIDEINRANLSSVLGELIYALEYRGKEVSSMYDLNNSDDTEQSDNEIILPPNLYIIGTMNTADRSVSQIDYAIRRRFAFVDILPKDLSHDPNVEFDHILFNSVAEIFIKDYDPDKDYSKEPHIVNSEHLSEEFSPKDVWLGHSYFIKHYEKDEQDEDIKDKPYDFKLRLEFEIKPILREYVKDGILKKSALIEIEKLVCF